MFSRSKSQMLSAQARKLMKLSMALSCQFRNFGENASFWQWKVSKNSSEKFAESGKFCWKCESNKTVEGFQGKVFVWTFSFAHEKCSFDNTAAIFSLKTPSFCSVRDKVYEKNKFYRTVFSAESFCAQVNFSFDNPAEKMSPNRTKNVRPDVQITIPKSQNW